MAKKCLDSFFGEKVIDRCQIIFSFSFWQVNLMLLILLPWILAAVDEE